MNQDIINEITNQDYSSITEKIEDFLSDKIEKNHAEGVILGLSGGIRFCSFSLYLQKETKRKNFGNHNARHINYTKNRN